MKSKSIEYAIASLYILLLLGLGAACTKSSAAAAAQPASTPTATAASTATQAPATKQALALGTKQSGNLTVSLSSNPNPPIRGNNIFEALVTDERGQTVPDAKLSFDIDMTNMSHGKDIITASSLGEGHYSGKVYFLMPGPWRLIVNIERGGQAATIRFDFNVNWK
jgi:hypothetical protein